MLQLLLALTATLVAQMLSSVSSSTGAILAPAAAPDLGVSVALVGIYTAIIWLSAAFAGLICAGFVTRFGALRVTQTCLVVTGAGLVITAEGSLAAVIFGAVLVGVGGGPMTPASSHILVRITPPTWMNFVFSAKQTGVPLGFGLAGLMVPALAVLYGWQAAALVAGLLSIVLAVALQPLRERFDGERNRDHPLLTTMHPTEPLKLAFGSPGLRLIIAMSFVYAGMQNSFSAFLVAYLHDQLYMTLVQAGFVFTIGQTAGAVGRLIWASLADRLITPLRLLGWLGIAMAVCAVLLAMFTTAWPLWLMLAVSIALGGTSVAWNGVYLAQVARLAPKGRVSEATGVSAFFTFGGVVVIPALFSLILSVTGSYAIPFILIAALSAAMGLHLLTTNAEKLEHAAKHAQDAGHG
jgi:MFS family permease